MIYFEDQEILEELVNDSEEHLASIEPDLLELEEKQAAASSELINRIFRAVHSIKGGFGYFGVESIQSLAHAMENVLSLVRDGAAVPTPVMVDALLKGVDRLREMLADVQAADEVDASAVIAALEPFLSPRTEAAATETDTGDDADDDDDEELRGDETMEELLAAAQATEVLAREAEESSVDDADAESMDELSAAVPDAASDVASDVALDAPPATSPAAPPAASPAASPAAPEKGAENHPGARVQGAESLRVKVDLLNRLMNQAGELVLARNQIVQLLGKKLNETLVGDVLIKNAHSAVERTRRRLQRIIREGGVATGLGEGGRSGAEGVLNMVARECDHLEAQIAQSFATSLSEIPGLNSAMVNVDSVTSDLQENIMRTRMQPLSAVFGRFPRVIRELCRQTGKEIRLHISGEEVELDKSIIEALSDPLNHLLRNSADHGIESPERREEVGKSRSGEIQIDAYHEGGNVNIAISDDGAGIDLAKVKAKALERGLIDAETAASMDDRDVVNLIFAPGFSTADRVTDVSGRGVGMDVVRSNIEALGGVIEVETRSGSGSTFTLKLPLTLAIIPSLLVAVAGRRFAVPQVSLEELVRVRDGDPSRRLERIKGADVLRLRDRLLPVVRLADLLGLREASSSSENKGRDGGEVLQVLVLKIGAQRYGLVVDAVHDSEEIVVKPLPAFLKEAACYSGATILGDGHVAMILDAQGIATFAALDFSGIEAEKERVAAGASKLESSESQTILLFRNHPEDLLAIHLALVSRIERVTREQLQTIGGKDYLRYPDRTLRLVHLHEVLPLRAPETESDELFVIIPKLVRHPLGIVATACENVLDVQVEVDRDNIRGPGILGSAVIDDAVALFIDIYGLFEVAEPELFHDDDEQKNSVEGARVLIAEDTPFFQAVERSYLTSLGATVRVAADGAEAWAMLNEPDALYDLLLTDIEMPRMDGLELIRRVRASTRYGELPIVALTALSNDTIREKCLNAGVTGFETKLDKERLGRVLNEILQRRRVHA